MPSKLLERDIERRVVAYAKSRNVLCMKFASPNNRGVPDRILIGPTGRIAFLELKRPGGKPTELQLHVLNKFVLRGCRATWCDNLPDATKLIDELV